MTWLGRQYNENRNGITITLLFHILVFVILNVSQFKIKEKYIEPEILIDFPEQIYEQIINQTINRENTEKIGISDQLKTNTASSRTASIQNKTFNDQYQKELEQAQNLVKEVSKQLTREIPTLNDLAMPDAPPAKSVAMEDKLYTGDSNIEYFLENRFHIKLPIPVYLAEGGGKVKVNIIVDRLGNVIKADPLIEIIQSTQILSYAKTAAMRTKFNPNPDSPLQQNGYILYNFIPQH